MLAAATKPVECRLCGRPTNKHSVTFRHGEAGEINACDVCSFHFVDKDPSTLLASDQLERFRLESAGMDVPAIAEDFANGLAQASDYIDEYFPGGAAGSRVLEVGCSWGYFLEAARRAGAQPTGVEINAVRAAWVRDSLGVPCYPSVAELPEASLFDRIFGFYVLEYFADPVAAVSALISRLAPGGSLTFITPNVHDVLLDVWHDPGYQDFFYDHCAVGYFSTTAVRRLLESAAPGYETQVTTRQGYGVINHLGWFLHHRPMPTGRVGSDRFAERASEQLSGRGELASEIAALISGFDDAYRKLIERYGQGNQIIFTVTRT